MAKQPAALTKVNCPGFAIHFSMHIEQNVQECDLMIYNISDPVSLHIEQNVKQFDVTMHNGSNPAGPIKITAYSLDYTDQKLLTVIHS